MKKKILIAALLIVVFITINITQKNSGLQIYKETKLSDAEVIDKIVKRLEYKKEYKSKTIEDNTLRLDYDVEMYTYAKFEENASFLFYLIDDLETVEINLPNEKYTYKRDKTLNMYDELTIKKIEQRYKKEPFKKYQYLGHINSNINLFDKSDLCLTKYEKLYEDDEAEYYITCSSLDNAIAIIDDKEYKLEETINKQIDINDLFDTNLKIEKRDKNENNS